MKNKEDKNIEKLVENLMMENQLESPSMNFTNKVMAEVLATQKSKTLVYKPVISKKAWFIIFGGIIALFTFLILNMNASSSAFSFKVSLFSFDKFFNPIYGMQISPVTANVVLLATVMLLIQIFLLKNYFTRKFQK
ncbi:MAG: hypothetical protein KGM16_03540 [Bacteroidota bacterium]|nr:hypothetical protein [Bacteroidota bacterium]